MGKQKRVRLWSLPSMQQIRAALLLAGSFALGSVLGCLFSARLEGAGMEALERYLSGYLALMQTDTAEPGWAGLVWPTFRMPLLVTVLRFTVLGVLLLPVVMGIRGFLLSFAISAFVRCYAWKGMGAALLLFGFPRTLEMLVLFVLAVRSWTCAQRRGRDVRREERQTGIGVELACYGLLLLLMLAELALAGPIAQGLSWLLADAAG